jgi:hypothetical protein
VGEEGGAGEREGGGVRTGGGAEGAMPRVGEKPPLAGAGTEAAGFSLT